MFLATTFLHNIVLRYKTLTQVGWIKFQDVYLRMYSEMRFWFCFVEEVDLSLNLHIFSVNLWKLFTDLLPTNIAWSRIGNLPLHNHSVFNEFAMVAVDINAGLSILQTVVRSNPRNLSTSGNKPTTILTTTTLIVLPK